MPSEPSLAGGAAGEDSVSEATGGGARARGASGVTRLEERERRYEEQTTRDRTAEIQHAIVIARRSSDEHILQHLFGCTRRTSVTDEVGAELALTSPAEGHIFAEDFNLFAVFDDCRQRIVRGSRLDRIVQLNIRELGAADDLFLDFRRQRVPSGQIVQILLDDDVAAGRRTRDPPSPIKCSVDRRFVCGVFRSIDEAEQIAVIKIAKAVDLVRGSELRHLTSP